jgi:ATP-binding cassette subfamily C (CFTR/MRP) protein 1
MVRMSTETENSFNSVERIVAYSHLPQEAPPVVEGHRPEPGWPSKGAVKLRSDTWFAPVGWLMIAWLAG